MATDDEVSRQYAPRQFSLAGLLSLFLACGLYFGLLTIAADILGFGRPTSPWRMISTIVISWGGLLVLYHYWKLRAALVIHYIGPMTCGMLALITLAGNLLINPVERSLDIFLYVFLYGPFISVLFGFPVVVVMLIYRVLKCE